MKTATRQSSLDAFHELSETQRLSLQDVYERVVDKSRESVTLRFGSRDLVLSVDGEDDTMIVECKKLSSRDLAKMVCASASFPWSSFIGKSFGWGWVTTNQQGYQDGVLLSFDGLEPTILLSAAASSLRIFSIKESVRERSSN